MRPFAFAFPALLTLLGANAARAADTPAVDPSIGRVEVTLDLPKDKPYVGEMIMLRMRSFIRADIVLDEVRQPPLINFDAQQLGRDKPIQAMVDGFNVDGIERDIAIFPEQSGRLIIPPFVRHVTIVNAAGQRVETQFASKQVFVDVQNYASINPPGAWWLPAKSLTITDSWTPEADEIPRGDLSRRTVIIEATGITADRLPPAPILIAPGIISFKGPAERTTTITEDGPVARATYRWDLRPTIGQPAKVPVITIPWFDTGERRMRNAALPERWVAYIGTLVHTRLEKTRTLGEQMLTSGPIAAGVIGFGWTAALVGFLVTGARPGRSSKAVRLLSKLRRTGRFGDAAGFADARAALARVDPARWARAIQAPDIATRLEILDAATYGRSAVVPPSLGPLASDIARAWRDEEVVAESASGSILSPLDGDALSSKNGRQAR